MLSTLDAFFQSQPYTAAAITCGIKASAADWIAQKRQRAKAAADSSTDVSSTDVNTQAETKVHAPVEQKTDLRRNLAFIVYGSFYTGICQEFIINHIYPTVFGAGTSFREVLSKATFEIFVQSPLLTLPIAYITKALISRYSIKQGLRNYWNDVRHQGLLLKYISLWFPIDCINFAFVPNHYRVTVFAVVSFFWFIILSTLSSKTPPLSETKPIEAGIETKPAPGRESQVA